jgi:hypothetical protein
MVEMDHLKTIIEMRKTLGAMNERLNSSSRVEDYQRYYDSLFHYKKILNNYMTKENAELDKAIEKAYRIKTTM